MNLLNSQCVLVTGASGFVGRHLCARLKMHGIPFYVLRRPNSNHDGLGIDMPAIEMNENLAENLKQHNISGIIHLATYYSKSHSSSEVQDMIEGNINFPTFLCESAIKADINFFINTGTFFEFDVAYSPISEETPKSPFNLYASTKSAFEKIIAYYANQHGLNAVSLNLFKPYGYGESDHKIVPKLCLALLEKRGMVIEKGQQSWDFVYINDIVSAYEKAIEYCLSRKVNTYQSFNIGTGVGTDIKQICEILNRVHGTELIKCEKEYIGPQIFNSVANPAKANNLLQWLPLYDIEAGLQETYTYFKKRLNS